MKPSFFCLTFFLVSRVSSYKSQSILPQKQGKGGYSNSKGLDNRSIFSPRMDYDEWTPLGRGDPLKNDPTYDYVPPVLDRVHYWMDPSKRTPDPPQSNSALLVLGSRTEQTFTTRPVTTQRYQTLQSKESHADSRIDTSKLLDPFFKLMDVSQFKLNFNSNSNNHYKQHLPNRIQKPHHQPNPQKRPQPPQALQRPPYTMLMPPPPPSTFQQTFLTTSQTITSPTNPTTTTIAATSNVPLTTNNSTTTNPTVLANTENVFKPVAISMPDSVKSTEKNVQNTTPKYEPRKPTTVPTTESGVVKRHPTGEYRVKQQQINSNLIQNPTTVTQKPTKLPPTSQTTLQTTTLPTHPTSPENYFRATTAPPVTTTRINTLTTDPMFKHYKQPSEPLRGPFYLIIQGHSKVKTYGASKNPVNRLPTSNEIKYDEDDGKKFNFERKTRRLPYDAYNKAENQIENFENEEVRSFPFFEEETLEKLEETFPKSDGGSSKKRYLANNRRRKRQTRRLLSEDQQKESETTENLDLESLIAISDDYDPGDVANILFKNEGSQGSQSSQGSGFGDFAFSIFGRSDDGQDVA